MGQKPVYLTLNKLKHSIIKTRQNIEKVGRKIKIKGDSIRWAQSVTSHYLMVRTEAS